MTRQRHFLLIVLVPLLLSSVGSLGEYANDSLVDHADEPTIAYLPAPLAGLSHDTNETTALLAMAEAERVVEDFIENPTLERLLNDWIRLGPPAPPECIPKGDLCGLCVTAATFPDHTLFFDAGPPATLEAPMVKPYGPSDHGTEFFAGIGWANGKLSSDLNAGCHGRNP